MTLIEITALLGWCDSLGAAFLSDKSCIERLIVFSISGQHPWLLKGGCRGRDALLPDPPMLLQGLPELVEANPPEG